MSFVLYFMVLVTAAIGTVISSFLVSNISIAIGGISATQMASLLSAVFWFLIAFATFFVAKRLNASPFGFVTLKFLLTWVFCTAGTMLGIVIADLINSGGVTVTTEVLFDSFFFILPLTIGPTATASMGLRESN